MEMRREARYYRARNGYIVDADEPSEALEVDGGLEFACDYGDDILAAVPMDLTNAESGSQIAESVYFVGWCLPRGKDAVKCVRCGGYAPEVDSTEEEIQSELNCHRSWACCCMAFVCDSCGARMVASREVPEME